ncbi:MAG: four helix bundle protein, partial [Flavobacteriales bacterium]|nr:four helix bundle protein [Flavobacteriales bacterium]
MVKRIEYKFEKLNVWKLAIEYLDLIYGLANGLPEIEKFNLCSQITRAETSISLNIADGSTSVSNKEQIRYLNISIHSYIETVACRRIITKRNYSIPNDLMEKVEV